jgi:DNA repair protein RecN (Recombination protein N)
VREARRTLQVEAREAERQQDILRHEVAEIERAELREDEEDELQAQRTRLQHVERLRQAATTAHQALMGAEAEAGDQPGAVDLLGQAVVACQDGARFDPALAAETENLNAALAQAEESARTLRDYLDTIEADPEALERTQERLFLIRDLERKYGETISDVLAYAAQARERLDNIEHRAERLADLEARENQLIQQLSAAAGDLSARRAAAAERLTTAVEKELTDLRLGGTHFAVSLTQADDPDGVPARDGRRLAFDTSGVDRVEFLIAANPGEEPRPMARVASGGELARIALALKTILSRAETRPTLIFDEVDVGIGGRTAPVVGEKLWSVAAGGHQVLCVTHMPQVAAFADHHYLVAKTSSSDRAETRVQVLEPTARIDELASMLAGSPTQSALDSARELLARAQTFKAASATQGAGTPPNWAGRSSAGRRRRS